MRRRSTWRGLDAGLAAVVLITGGSLCPAASPRLGLVLPSEPLAAAAVRDGAELALDASLGPVPVAVDLVIRESAPQWGTDGNEAARLVLDEGVALLIAPPDGAASHLILQVAGRTRVPVISLCGDSSVTAAGIPWMVRCGPSTVDEARVLLAEAATWVALVPPGREGREVAADLRRASEVAGVRDLAIEEDPAVDRRGETVARVLRGSPGGVLVWLGPDAAREWVLRLRDAGFAGIAAGPGRLRTQAFTADGGARLAGFRVAEARSPAAMDRRWERFGTVFQQRHGREPEALARRAAEAVWLAIGWIGQAGEHSAPIPFPRGGVVEGPTGVWAFTRSGDAVVELRVGRWTGQSWEAKATGR